MVGVLLFFEEFTLFVGVLACFLQRVALHAVLSAFGFFKGLLYLWGCLACLEVVFCLLLFQFL